MTGTADPASTGSLARRAAPALLLLCMLLPTSVAFATAGFAGYSWYFHDRPGQWIEWPHGDICPPEAPRKECAFVWRSKAGDRWSDFVQSEALLCTEGPQGFYVNTILALLPLAIGWFGLARLWGRWRQQATDPGRWNVLSTWVLGLVTVLAWWKVPYALLFLFPPMMLPNIVVSLLAVAAASAVTNAMACHATASSGRSDPPPRDGR